MAVTKSLGGIGRLYRDDFLLSEVYYNIKLDQLLDHKVGTIVFVDTDIELPNDNSHYCLFLEDGRYLKLTISRNSSSRFSPYSCTSCDGILYSECSYLFS